MEVCQKTVDELGGEITGDADQMDELVVRIEHLITELASVEILANKLFVL